MEDSEKLELGSAWESKVSGSLTTQVSGSLTTLSRLGEQSEWILNKNILWEKSSKTKIH